MRRMRHTEMKDSEPIWRLVGVRKLPRDLGRSKSVSFPPRGPSARRRGGHGAILA